LHFAGLKDYRALRSITRALVVAWRKDLEFRGLEPSTIRRKLAALSSLLDYLCERDAVAGNPVDGVKRRRPAASISQEMCSRRATFHELANTPAHTARG
jgi:integrase/recombinase XerD